MVCDTKFSLAVFNVNFQVKFTNLISMGDSSIDKKRENIIGPTLPPNLQNSGAKETKQPNNFTPNVVIGPALLPESNKKMEIIIGPQLPAAHARTSTSSKVMPDKAIIGPSLPPGFKKRVKTNNLEEGNNNTRVYPTENVFGPMPITDTEKQIYEERERQELLQRIEQRATRKPAPEKKISQRPEWMTVPPELNRLDKVSGLKSRSFRRTTFDEGADQSSWTRMPGDSDDSNPAKKIKHEAVNSTKDELYREMVEQYNSEHRTQSLVEQHLKKKPQPVDASLQRFDRDRDLTTRTLSESSKKKMIGDSTNLNSKFSHGSSSFL
jgi:hypothetical protein